MKPEILFDVAIVLILAANAGLSVCYTIAFFRLRRRHRALRHDYAELAAATRPQRLQGGE